MGFFKAPLSSLASAIFFAYAQASYLQNELSFGHTNDKYVSLYCFTTFPKLTYEGYRPIFELYRIGIL